MTDKLKKCQELYQEYTELVKRTHIKIEEYEPGKPITPQYIKPQDLLRKEEIRLQLLDCLDCLDLSTEEAFEIENG